MSASLGPYVRAIRSHALLFTLVTLAALGTAALLLSARSPTYEATAELLVTPLPQADRTFLGIALLRDSVDPTRTMQTAAAVISSPVAAARTARELGGDATRRSVENAVVVEPVGESNIVGITAQAESAGGAAELANRYAANALQVTSEVLREQVVSAIAQSRAALQRKSPVPLSPEDTTRLSELRAVRDRGDPTLSLSQAAQPPPAPTDAPAWLVLVLALVAGVTLAAIVAVLTERLDRRVRDVDELFALAPIAVLARVPAVRRGKRDWPALEVPPAVRESFRTLQIQIDQRRSDRGQASCTIVVTSPSRGDGKTTTTICLALALVAAGHDVVLLDCDLRRPDIGSRLRLDASGGLEALLSSGTTLADTLLSLDRVQTLRVLPAVGGAGDIANMHLLSRRAAEILAEAGSLADYVIVDTPPLGIVGDALALAPYADELLLVGRTHHSDRRTVESTVALLQRANTPPTGWVVIADSVRRRDTYSYAGSDTATSRRRSRTRSPVG